MQISINEVTGDHVELTVDEVKGIEPIITIEGTIDPGQPFRAATGRDPIGQQGFDATFEIDAASIEVTPTYKTSILISQIIDQLVNSHFFTEVMEKINEHCQP